MGSEVAFPWNQSNEPTGHLSKLSVSSWGNSYLSPEAQLHMKTLGEWWIIMGALY
jgi:hypothetical protein